MKEKGISQPTTRGNSFKINKDNLIKKDNKDKPYLTVFHPSIISALLRSMRLSRVRQASWLRSSGEIRARREGRGGGGAAIAVLWAGGWGF